MKKLLRGWPLAILGVLLAVAVFAFPPTAPQTYDAFSDITTGSITVGAAEHLVLPLHDDAATPTLAFGDGDSGIYETSDDILRMAINGTDGIEFATSYFYATGEADGPCVKYSSTTATDPVFVTYSDQDTGIGRAGVDQLSLIAGATELARGIEGTTDGFTRTIQRLYPATLNDTSTAHALLVNELWDTIITTQGWNGNDDIEFTLPDISSYVTGSPVLKVKFLDSVGEQDGDADFYIDPDGSTQIVLDGTITGTDGDRVWNDNTTIYDSIVCHSDYDPTLAGYWVCDSINGTWADKGS